MNPWWAVVSGVAAGLGLVAPLGAVGVLLIRDGVAVGFRQAASAGAAVAVVDATYCTLALTAGSAVSPVIARLGPWPAMAAGLVLIVVGGVGWWHSRTSSPRNDEPIATARSTWTRRFALFVGITAVNPATVLYFAALAVALGEALTGPTTVTLFVIAVATTSLLWQLGLIAIGAQLRGRVSPRIAWTVTAAGHLVVIALGAVAIIGAALN